MFIPDIAKYQRLLIVAILCQIILYIIRVVLTFGATGAAQQGSQAGAVAMGGIVLLLNLVSLAVVVFSLVMLILLMTAMDESLMSRVLAAISQFIPLIGLIVLLVINGKATKLLRENGYKVGLMGAKPAG